MRTNVNQALSYSIEDSNGNQITAGLQGHTARRIAQRMADERGESVYLYAGEDDSDEIEPSSIDVLLDAHNGPLVEYGGHDAETVEAEIPEGYAVDWSSAIETSVTGAHTLRYRAPLVPDGLVVVETMPDHLRGSHQAARNWGVYPHNGAERARVTREEAEEIVAGDSDGYARIVA